MLVITRPSAETTKPSTMPVGPVRSDAAVTGLVSTSTTDTDFAWAIDPAVCAPPPLLPEPPTIVCWVTRSTGPKRA